MFQLDHFCLGVRELSDGVRRLRDETGLGGYEGGVFAEHGVGNWIFPVGDDVYLEAEAVVGDAPPTGPAAWFAAATRDGLDRWMFWSLRADTREELEEVAARLGGEVQQVPGRTEPDGTLRVITTAPGGRLTLDACWRRGLPNWYYRADPSTHPARRTVQDGRASLGVSWFEVGGDEEEIRAHVGAETFDRLPLRVVPDEVGLLAVAVRVAGGHEVVIRRPSAAGRYDLG